MGKGWGGGGGANLSQQNPIFMNSHTSNQKYKRSDYRSLSGHRFISDFYKLRIQLKSKYLMYRYVFRGEHMRAWELDLSSNRNGIWTESSFRKDALRPLYIECELLFKRLSHLLAGPSFDSNIKNCIFNRIEGNKKDTKVNGQARSTLTPELTSRAERHGATETSNANSSICESRHIMGWSRLIVYWENS